MSDIETLPSQRPETQECRKGPMDILNQGAREGRLDDLSPEDMDDLGKVMTVAVFGVAKETREEIKAINPNRDDWADK